jgi:hypothetical protein
MISEQFAKRRQAGQAAPFVVPARRHDLESHPYCHQDNEPNSPPHPCVRAKSAVSEQNDLAGYSDLAQPPIGPYQDKPAFSCLDSRHADQARSRGGALYGKAIDTATKRPRRFATGRTSPEIENGKAAMRKHDLATFRAPDARPVRTMVT